MFRHRIDEEEGTMFADPRRGDARSRGALPGSGVSIVLAFALAGSLSAPRDALASIEIVHDGLDCVQAERFPVIRAGLIPEEDVARARVYFRAAGTEAWYSVDMQEGEEGGFEGILPQPLPTLDAIDYYIEAHDPSAEWYRSEEYSADVIDGPATCDGLMATALGSVSSTLRIGVPAGAPGVPAGFGGLGLGGIAGGAAAGAAAAGGISTAVLVGGGAVAVGAAAAVAAGGGDEREPPGEGSVSRPTPAPTPAPTPTPTPEPSVSGHWVGSFVENPSDVQCSVATGLDVTLEQSGSEASGTFVMEIRDAKSAPADPCPVGPGDVFNGPANASISGSSIVLTLQIPNGPAAVLPGMIMGDTMGGTSPPDAGGPGGTWELMRQ
jgi:hypothetical protein